MLSDTYRLTTYTFESQRLKNEIAMYNSSHPTIFSNSLKPALYCLTQALNLKKQHTLLLLSNLTGDIMYEKYEISKEKPSYLIFLP
jgi:hypothetical protein